MEIDINDLVYYTYTYTYTYTHTHTDVLYTDFHYRS